MSSPEPERPNGADSVSDRGPLGYPDVVIAGAARSGSSFLAARLSAHPAIDGGAVKEPNYFSRNFDRGPDWYDDLFQPRRPGLLRLDASVSYTYPQHPDALTHLAAASPEAKVVYVVRDPVARAVSHYRLLHQYFQKETEPTFGRALATNDVYLGASDYERWLGELEHTVGRERLLVVPFQATTSDAESLDAIFAFVGLEPIELGGGAGQVQRNEVVEFRQAWMRPARRALSRSRAYPWLRRRLGADRMRRLRGLATRRPEQLTVADALASCTDAQRREIDELAGRANAAAEAALSAQDRDRGLSWAALWRGEAGEPTAQTT